MNEFIEKWRNDSKFKAKVQLSIYGIFMLFAIVFAFVANSTVNYDNESLTDKTNQDNQSEQKYIVIPDKYKYSINIDLNNQNYKYNGIKKENTEEITKIKNDKTYYYIEKKGTYYKNSVVINNIIDKSEVYDIIEANYLSIETINQYLTKAKESNNQYIVYLEDIILGTDKEDYITITKDKNKINVDYTSLLKEFDKSIEKVNVEIILEEIE